MAQRSNLGVPLGNLIISGIGQADDTALVSNNLYHLKYLLELTKSYCSKHFVDLTAEKTRLLLYRPSGKQADIMDHIPDDIININGQCITFTDAAEHVGVIRSTSGNRPAILARLTAHRRSLASILHTGLARGHRGNPASSIQLHMMYCCPVLFSGIATLVLSNKEIQMVEKHYADTIRRLLRLNKGTPRAVTYFLAGSLPGIAMIHMRQLSIFGMITRLDGNILHTHAVNYFLSKTISKHSWFHQIRSWCLLYGLPHPIDLLNSPLSKESFKSLVKKNIVSYWENLLRSEASILPSLQYFHPSYMSLVRPHSLWTSAGHSPAKIFKATVQALMLSGRYPTEALIKHWSPNKTGICQLSSSCSVQEDISHILTGCIALDDVRINLRRFTEVYIFKLRQDSDSDLTGKICNLLTILCNPSYPTFCQFLLDCASLPEVISLTQELGKVALYHLHEVARTWIYVLHRERLKLLGRWRQT